MKNALTAPLLLALATSAALVVDVNTLAPVDAAIMLDAADKSIGTLYNKLFVRHWDTWSHGRRNHGIDAAQVMNAAFRNVIRSTN